MVIAVGAALAVPAVASATPTGPHAAPTTAPIGSRIKSVQQRLGELALRNDEIVEKYNQADTRYQATKRAAGQAEAAYRAAQRRFVAAQNELAQTAALQYEGGTFSATGALLSSSSGSNYLDQLETLSMLSQHNSQVVSSFKAVKQQAREAKIKAENLFAEAEQTRASLQRQHRTTQAQIAKFKQLLSTLDAQQRAIWAARSGAEITAGAAREITAADVGATSAAARIAVQFALAQVGKPYVFGAAGPDAFDCSGLTMASWAHAGVSLPHSALEQYNYGHHVSFDQLEPGDLMFFYQPIAHVTIYIGDGLMVSAPEPGESVKVVPASAFGSDFVGATRLVG